MSEQNLKKSNFPLVFGRKGGDKINFLSQLSTPHFEELHLLQSQKEENISVKKELLLDVLYQEIQKDKSHNTQLIKLRRAVFNNQNLEKFKKIPFENRKPKTLFYEYFNLLTAYNNEVDGFNSAFEKELKDVSIKIAKIATKPYFSNGLLFSSHILYNEINKSNFNFEVFNKKKRRLILSLLKYLTRSITKTTPFSSFNSIFLLSENDDRSYSSKPEKTQSFYQINNVFFYYLKEALTDLKIFKDNLPLIVNPTLWRENAGAELHFFLNHENNETFKKVTSSPILEFIIKETTHNKINYSVLVAKLMDATSHEKSTVENFVDQLLKQGVIQILYPISFNDPQWPTALRTYITNNFSDPYFLTVTGSLNILEEHLSNMPLLCIDQRKHAINECFKAALALLQHLNYSSSFTEKLKPQDFIYEDVMESVEDHISRQDYDKITDNLKKAYFNLNFLPFKKERKMQLSEQLAARQEVKLPLLKFYERIYLQDKSMFQYSKTCQKELDRILQLIEELKNKQVERKEFIDLAPILSSEDPSTNVSFGAYIQRTDPHFSKIILNGFSNGGGVNSARFLNNCSNDTIEKVRTFISTSEETISDVKDSSLHNVNVYPALTELVISTDNNQGLADQYRLLNLSDLYVKSFHGQVVLVDQNDSEVIPIRYSLEGLHRKSKFAQFLDLFNPEDSSGYHSLLESINQLFQKDLIIKDTLVIPELRYGENLVIQRKKWLIKKKQLTSILFDTTSNTSSIYYNLNKWRINKGIPAAIFIKLRKQDLKQPKGDNYKPQYINFSIPVFTLLLQNIVKTADNIIELTEVSPTHEEVNHDSGFVKEYVLTIT
jgi:hypothetical protein